MIFELNKKYLMNWITNSTLKTMWTVIRRTAKTLTIESHNGRIEKRRIKRCTHTNSEYVNPFGIYSMSPVLYAKNIKDNGESK